MSVPNEQLRANGQGLYSRLWCIWEIKVAADEGLPIKIVHERRTEEHLLGKSTSSRSARCGNPSEPMNKDEKLIRDAIANMPPESARSSAFSFFIICFCISYGAALGGSIGRENRWARLLLSSWLRHEEEAAQIRSAPRAEVLAPPKPERPSSAKCSAYRTVEGRLKDVRTSAAADPQLAADVDVALNLLAERRREATKALAASRAPVALTRPLPPALDPALRMEVRHRQRSLARETSRDSRNSRDSGDGADGSGRTSNFRGVAKPKPRPTPVNRQVKRQASRQSIELRAEGRKAQQPDLAQAAAQLEEEADKARHEAEREAQAMRERAAEGRAKATAAKNAAAKSAAAAAAQRAAEAEAETRRQRRKGATKLGVLLQAWFQRTGWASCHFGLQQLQKASRALQRKERIVASKRAMLTLCSCAHAWREAVANAVAERSAALHLEQQRQQQHLDSAARTRRHQRLSRKAWLGWCLALQQRRREEELEVVAAKTSRFLAQLKESQEVAPSVADAEPPAGTASASSEPAGPADPAVPAVPAVPAEVQPDTSSAARASRISRPRTRALLEIEQRAEERRKAQQERKKRSQSAEPSHPLEHEVEPASRSRSSRPRPEQLGGAPSGAELGEAAEPAAEPPAAKAAPRPKAVLEMERRAQERRRAHEERRQRQLQKEEELRLKEQEEEEKQRQAEEEAKREKLRQKKEQQLLEQRVKAQRLVAHQLRQAKERGKLTSCAHCTGASAFGSPGGSSSAAPSSWSWWRCPSAAPGC
ncbi:unnamed protein product [Effrenium voratum]|nr:unnamed protein product [Effrenium voratum]